MKYLEFIKFWLKYSFAQNTYLFPNERTKNLWHPYKRKHLWRTRIGFIAGWGVANAICDMRGRNDN